LIQLHHRPDFRLLKFRVNKQNRIAVFVALAVLFLIPYLLNNRLGYFPSHEFELTGLEQMIPFWDWSVWVYASDYLFPFVIGYQLHIGTNLSRVCFGFFLMSILTNLIFFFYPVRYPRELFPLADDSSLLMRWIREVDSPVNCFPSAHVAIVWVTLLAIRRERPEQFPRFLVWAILICVSTLTTKQHYLVDVIGGIFTGYVCFAAAEHLIKE
jgi:membrane-associated phospholipid phosphatase